MTIWGAIFSGVWCMLVGVACWFLGRASGRDHLALDNEETSWEDDAPYNVFSTVPVMPGYQAMLENRFGGYDETTLTSAQFAEACTTAQMGISDGETQLGIYTDEGTEVYIPGQALDATGWLRTISNAMGQAGSSTTTAGNLFLQPGESVSPGIHERLLRETDWALMAAWDVRIWSQEELQDIAHWRAEFRDWTDLSDWDGVPAETRIPEWAR